MSLQHIDMVRTLEQIEESALIQLVYVSSITVMARFKKSLFADVKRRAGVNNEQRAITGILCYGNGHFLQCIEGEKAHVVALLQRISSDKRHKNVEVLLLQAIDQRSFGDWRMRLLFLERWLWSPATKEQATQLSTFLSFAPYDWGPERTEQFLRVIKTFETDPHIKSTGITYSAIGSMFRHIIGPHQAFLVVQGILSLLIVVAIILLFL
ncbi:BLUF domain-containing protein [Psychrobacter sp. 72-O-c]|uniref:BLUF domain-containing protein n=1 Tax=Psychrobacter sp. 72-O-c TaxID=2774125 RepID=UPI00191B32CF|nr:BLUF domain-containing protein [Psychrobacter sp. 72-O-c]